VSRDVVQLPEGSKGTNTCQQEAVDYPFEKQETSKKVVINFL